MSVRAIFIRTLCERTLGQNPVSHWKLLLQVRGASNDTRGKKRPEIQLSCGKKERLPLLFFFFPAISWTMFLTLILLQDLWYFRRH